MKNRSPLLKKFKIWFKRLLGQSQWVGEWSFIHYNSDGTIKDSWKMYNALLDEGEQDILDIVFRDATEPTSFYIGLCNSTPGETTTLSTLSGEVTGGGYARIALARNNTDFPTLALNSGDYQLTSLSKSFVASGGAYSSATSAFLCTVASGSSGKLYATVALSATRTLADGESLAVTFNIKLQ
jgi:hypothetical protein